MRGAKNIRLLEIVARRLHDVLPEVVFVGGATVSLFLTDPAAGEVRTTRDVDVIVNILALIEYHKLETRLRALGFVPVSEIDDFLENAPRCRFEIEGILLDVMPVSEEVLGFANSWYAPAVDNARLHTLPSGTLIRLVDPVHFLATKIEAFYGRGAGDYLGSRDIEDIIALFDGRLELVQEIAQAPKNIKDFISGQLSQWLADEDFLDALPGHFFADEVSQSRVSLVLKEMNSAAGLG